MSAKLLILFCTASERPLAEDPRAEGCLEFEEFLDWLSAYEETFFDKEIDLRLTELLQDSVLITFYIL